MEPTIDDIFKRLLATIPEAKAVAIFSTEGLPIASVLPQGVDETKMAALIAALHSLAKRSVIEMRKGNFDHLYVKGSNGYLLVRQAGPNAVLTVSTTKDVRLGSIFLDSDPQSWSAGKAYEKIISIMIKDSVNKLVISRRYLPEILSPDILEISNDGLPSLKPFALKYLVLKGIKTKFYGNMVKFSLPHLKKIASIEKLRKEEKKKEKKKKKKKKNIYSNYFKNLITMSKGLPL